MRKLITFFSLMISLGLMAQKTDFGHILEAEYRGYTPHVVGEDEQDIFCMDYDDDEITIESFDKRRLRSNYRKVIELPSDWGVHEKLERLSYVNGNFVYFFSLFHNREDRFELHANTIDAKSGRIKDKKVIYSKTIEKTRDRGFYDVYVSKNKRSVLVRTASYYDDMDRTIENLVLLDENLDQVLEKEYTTEGEYVSISSSLVVDDEGSLYFLQDKDIVILDAFADFEEWREPIPLDEIESNGGLKNVYLSLNPNQDLVVIGSYVTKDIEDTGENKMKDDTEEGDTQVEGMFYLLMDGLNKEVASVKLNKFNKEYIAQYRTEDHIEDNLEAEVNDDFNEFKYHFREDGSVVFVGEDNKNYTYYSNGGMAGQDHYFNDLAVYYFAPDGTLKWAQRIPKKQKFYWTQLLLGLNSGSYGMAFINIPVETRGYFSYTGYFDDDKFYIVYNESDENTAPNYLHKELDEMKKFKKSVPVVHGIDLETGGRKRNVQPNLIPGDLYLKPSLSYQADIGSPVYFFCTYKKDYRLGKLEI